MLANQSKAFVAAGFDQCRDQEHIEQPIGFWTTDDLVKRCAVGRGVEGCEGNVATAHDGIDLMKVEQFFLGEVGEFVDEFGIGWVARHEF
jgi:hypothetical protein